MSDIFKYKIDNEYALVSNLEKEIKIPINDFKQKTTELGFSIKSQLGKPATLFNSSGNTNFIYKINSKILSDNEILEINSINSKSKIQDRIKLILNKGCTFEFVKTTGNIFQNNLILIDSLMPKLLSELIIDFNSSSRNKIRDLIPIISQTNPLNFDLSTSHNYYSYKIKRFLTDIALGMLPTKVWSGKLEATGGYLIVKESGEILCYHIYNRNEFENYLIKNTKLINPSSTRLNFGKVYIEENVQYFNLNMQIRFLK